MEASLGSQVPLCEKEVGTKLLATVRLDKKNTHRGLQPYSVKPLKPLTTYCGHVDLTRKCSEQRENNRTGESRSLYFLAPEPAVSRQPPAGSDGGLCPASAASGRGGLVLEGGVKNLQQETGTRHWSTAASRPP